MDAFLQSQIDFILAFQSLPGLTGLMEFFTFLGREEFFLLLLPLVYLCFDKATGLRLALVLVFGDALSGLTKMAFHSPRPYWIDSRVQALSTEVTYGLPSNHAQVGLSIWFYLASVLRRPWAWAVAALVALFISASRLYLGVHFPSDVIGGWILGGLLLFAFLKVEPAVKDRLSRMGLSAQIGVAFAASLGIALAGILVRAAVSGVADPVSWADFSREARTLNGLFTDAGVCFGVGMGWALASRWACFDAGGPPAKRAARFIIGLVVVGGLYAGLRAIFPAEPEALGLALRYVRYALMGWAAIFAVPWLCLKLKLADPA